jgi:hypothetical protein
MDVLSTDDLARFKTAVTEAVQPFLENGRVHLQATVRCAFGRR